MLPLLSFLMHYIAACRGQFFDYQVTAASRDLLQAISQTLHMLSAAVVVCGCSPALLHAAGEHHRRSFSHKNDAGAWYQV